LVKNVQQKSNYPINTWRATSNKDKINEYTTKF